MWRQFSDCSISFFMVPLSYPILSYQRALRGWVSNTTRKVLFSFYVSITDACWYATHSANHPMDASGAFSTFNFKTQFSLQIFPQIFISTLNSSNLKQKSGVENKFKRAFSLLNWKSSTRVRCTKRRNGWNGNGRLFLFFKIIFQLLVGFNRSTFLQLVSDLQSTFVLN